MCHFKTTMKRIFIASLSIIILSNFVKAQDTSLTANILYPRLNSTNWAKDWDKLNSNYSNIANTCQTCVWKYSDTLVSRFCFNTTLSHVKLDSATQIHSVSDLFGNWTTVNVGVIEVVDSFFRPQENGFRTTRIIDQPKNYKATLKIKNKKITYTFLNNGKYESKSERFKLIDNKYIVHKSLFSVCGPRYIGITKTGFLIIDQLTGIQKKYKKLNAYSYTTTITRTILKRTE